MFKAGYISFLSDFGLADETVSVCKGVILSRNPDANILDISYMVSPFDIISGGWLLAGSFPYLPAGIHLVIVDPGVGSDRAILIVEALRGDIFVGPDNGILLPALKKLGGVKCVYRIKDEYAHGRNVTATFHGRDIMAPIVAFLSKGCSPGEYGISIDQRELKSYPVPSAVCDDSGQSGYITLVDHFGTIRSNIPWSIGEESQCEVRIGSSTIKNIPVGRTFSDVKPGMPVILQDSWGYFSVAVNQGRACSIIPSFPGDPLSVKLTM